MDLAFAMSLKKANGVPGLCSCVSYADSVSWVSWAEVVVELMCFDLGHSVRTTSRKRVDSFVMRSAEAQKKLLDETVVAFDKALQLNRNRFEGGAASGSEVINP